MREARSELDRIAREHPDLAGESSADNRAAWEALLAEEEKMAKMGDSKLIAFRLPETLLKRIDEHAERLAKQTGLTVSRSDCARVLLNRGLADVEKDLHPAPAGEHREAQAKKKGGTRRR